MVGSRGFSLAELILSLGLFAVAIMCLLGLSLSVMRTDSKALESAAGKLIADQIVQRLVNQIHVDVPSGSRANFMSAETSATPYSQGEVVNDHTTFYYKVQVSTVLDTTGDPIGKEAASNRLKKVDVHVWWTEEANQTRQGSGRLEVRTTQLVSEASLGVPEAP